VLAQAFTGCPSLTSCGAPIRASYVYMEMAADHAMMAAMHGSFDETASNSTILGAEDLLDAA
jgi:hypothetical protein